MAYQLMILNKKYENIDIRRHTRFICCTNFTSSSSLQEIDLFTSQFYDEEHLRYSLMREGLIENTLLKNRISIRYKSKDYDTLKDSIVYSELKKYLDEDTLKTALKILSTDEGFLSRLLDNYEEKNSDYHRINYNREVIQIIRSIINNSYNKDRLKHFLIPYRTISEVRNVLIIFDYCDVEMLLKALIMIFYNNEIYSRKPIPGVYNYTYRDYDDYYEFDHKAKYRNLHDLAIFTGRYDIERKNEEEKEYQEEFLEPEEIKFDDSYIVPTSVRKVRKRVKKQIEGQTSFFE